MASRLLDMLAREDLVVEQVAALLRLSPEFVAASLRPPAKAAVGFERQIRSLARTAALLGGRRLRALIAAVALRQPGGAQGSLYGYWRQTVAAGFRAAGMAKDWGRDPDEAYPAAVMEDRGAWDSRRDPPVAPWGGRCEGADGQALADMVGLACGSSESAGFSGMLQAAAAAGLDEILGTLPELARKCVPTDLRRLNRVLQDRLTTIWN